MTGWQKTTPRPHSRRCRALHGRRCAGRRATPAGESRVQSRRAADPFRQLLLLPRPGRQKPQGGLASRSARRGDHAARRSCPSKPQESELVKRILTDDPDELMPPPDSHKKLTARQKEILERWIAQGAAVSAALGLRAAGQGGDSCRTKRRRCAGRKAACRDRYEAGARSRPPHVDSPVVFGLARSAADA